MGVTVRGEVFHHVEKEAAAVCSGHARCRSCIHVEKFQPLYGNCLPMPEALTGERRTGQPDLKPSANIVLRHSQNDLDNWYGVAGGPMETGNL